MKSCDEKKLLVRDIYPFIKDCVIVQVGGITVYKDGHYQCKEISEEVLDSEVVDIASVDGVGVLIEVKIDSFINEESINKHRRLTGLRATTCMIDEFSGEDLKNYLKNK